ncbi:MAG: tRNA (adenosine(37)-N6)-threonylcarbamoyltransferase complex ATPase subunit type 1 TsaE [Acidiferrobacterales bacterium]
MSDGERAQYQVPNERRMEQFGACLSPLIGHHVLLTLQGELGAGKTTLVRGLLRGAGYSGPVKSPTFSLVEPYEIGSSKVFHFDLYRLQDPEELEYIGIRDYLATPALCVIEWPEKAGDFLPVGDIHIMIKRTGQGRELKIQALTERGQKAMRDNSLPDCWSAADNEVPA